MHTGVHQKPGYMIHIKPGLPLPSTMDIHESPRHSPVTRQSFRSLASTGNDGSSLH